mgnify:CR=1 FL=1
MGYYIRFLPRKKRPPTWKIQYVSYKRQDLSEPISPTSRRTWDIPRERWRSMGFHLGMNLAEAKTRSRQLNAQLMLKRQEEKIRQIQTAKQDFRTRTEAVLPVEFVEEFETWFIQTRDPEDPKGHHLP